MELQKLAYYGAQFGGILGGVLIGAGILLNAALLLPAFLILFSSVVLVFVLSK